VYLIAHKDVTDMNDETNIFLKGGWTRASLVCAVLGALAAVFLFPVSFYSVALLALWAFNAALKVGLMSKIYYSKKITKRFRDRAVLFEFLTPYFYAAAFLMQGVFI
jgi:hypothetical protein